MWNFFTQIKIEYFQDYLKMIRVSIKNDLQKLEEENQRLIDEGAKQIENEYGYFDPFEDLANQAYQIKELEQLMLSTFVIGVFIFLEDQFNTVCKLIERESKIHFSYKDLKGNGVSRSITYLEKVLDRKFPTDLGVKEDFRVAQIIRNSFVHNDALIEKNYRSQIIKYVDCHSNILSLNQVNKIEVTCEYGNFLIDLISKVSSELEMHIPKTGFYQ